MTSLLREINYRYIMDWDPFDDMDWDPFVDELMWEWAFHDFWTQVGIAGLFRWKAQTVSATWHYGWKEGRRSISNDNWVFMPTIRGGMNDD